MQKIKKNVMVWKKESGENWDEAQKRVKEKQEGWKGESKGEKMLIGNADMTQERQRVAKRESEGGRKVGK
jgi:hypothetical protein